MSSPFFLILFSQCSRRFPRPSIWTLNQRDNRTSWSLLRTEAWKLQERSAISSEPLTWGPSSCEELEGLMIIAHVTSYCHQPLYQGVRHSLADTGLLTHPFGCVHVQEFWNKTTDHQSKKNVVHIGEQGNERGVLLKGNPQNTTHLLTCTGLCRICSREGCKIQANQIHI